MVYEGLGSDAGFVARDRARGNLDANKAHNGCFSLYWQQHAPIFQGEFRSYIWQPYRDPCSYCYAHVFLLNSPRDGAVERVIVAFRSSESMDLFLAEEVHASPTYKDSKNDYGVSSAPDPDDAEMSSALRDVIYTILRVFRVMVSESNEFMRGCLKEIQAMVNFPIQLIEKKLTESKAVHGQKSPSTNKIRFLIYLEACLSSLSHNIEHATQVLANVKSWSDSKRRSPPSSSLLAIPRSDDEQRHSPLLPKRSDNKHPFDTPISQIHQELTLIQSDITTLTSQIQRLNKTMREQLELTQTGRQYALTVLAAFYLPLSFTTSLLGMNIDPTSLYTYAQQGQNPFPPPPSSFDSLENSTIAVVQAIGSSGPLTWDWETFGLIAGGLLMTLPLLLALHHILRFTVRVFFMRKTAGLWTIASCLTIFFLAVFVPIFITNRDKLIASPSSHGP